jgi:hypothetical protein
MDDDDDDDDDEIFSSFAVLLTMDLSCTRRSMWAEIGCWEQGRGDGRGRAGRAALNARR